MATTRSKSPLGPLHPSQIASGDPCELSNGHPVFCAPTGRAGTGPNGLGFAVLDSDPLVKNAGVDTGIELADRTLRAPDVTVNFEDGEGTWASRAALALEYADKGQDERDLRTKIAQLLEGGTRWVWVVRLVGHPRVEVHEKGAPVRLANLDEELTAPGVLALPVPVRALFERDAAHETTLRNLLRAQGYADLEQVRREAAERAREEGALRAQREALLRVLALRSLEITEAQRAQVEACVDGVQLARWLERAVLASDGAAVFA